MAAGRARELCGGLDLGHPGPVTLAFHANQIDRVVVFVGAIVGFDELERPITGRVHDALHVEDRVERRNSKLLGDLRVGRGGFDGLTRVDDRNFQLVLQDPQQGDGVQRSLTDTGTDFEWEIVDRPRKRLVVHVTKATDAHHLDAVAEPKRRNELRRRRHPMHLDGGDLQLDDAFLKVVEKPGVLDRREQRRRFVRDERTLAVNLHEHAIPHELAKGIAQRDAADVQLAAEFVFRRNLRSRRVLAFRNPVTDQMLNLLIERYAELAGQAGTLRRGSSHAASAYHLARGRGRILYSYPYMLDGRGMERQS